MENNKIVIIGLLVLIIVLLAGILVLMPNMNKQDGTVEITDNITSDKANSVTPDTISVELPEFDKTYTETAGEYRIEASKWMGHSLGGFDVYLYKNGERVNKDSYMSRAYFYMDGEWKWSEWGNGENDYDGHHRYPVSSGVEIREVEVKF